MNTRWAAVEFEPPPIDLQQRLEMVIQTEVALATMPSVLVVDTDEWKLAHVAEQLAQHARRALLAMNAVDAVGLLESPEEQIMLVMVGTSVVVGTGPQTFFDEVSQIRRDVHRAMFEQPLSAPAMRRMLDMAEAEASSHAPWTADDFR